MGMFSTEQRYPFRWYGTGQNLCKLPSLRHKIAVHKPLQQKDGATGFKPHLVCVLTLTQTLVGTVPLPKDTGFTP